MKNLHLDLYRALFLLWSILKFGAGPAFRAALRLPPKGPSLATRVRLAFEDLGLTYLKLGQFLAMRFDILPDEVCRELQRLFENVRPMPFGQVKKVVEKELGGRLDELFHSFNPEPIAAASVAQVHQGQTHSGDRVAIKIQRPGIERIFAADMRNLRRIALAADALGLLGSLSMTEAVDEFALYTNREMDFVIEGTTANRLRENATENEIVPKIFWEFTTSKVLTMDFIDGVSLSQIGNLLEEGGLELVSARYPGLDLIAALHHLAFASLHQLFLTGFFHADPHPGNILILLDNTVAFIDFGIFGEVTEWQREILATYIENLAIGNVDESVRHYAKLYAPTDKTDMRVFKEEAKVVLGSWYHLSKDPDTPVEERLVGKFSDEMMTVVRKNKMKIGMDTLLFWRALIVLDSTALRLSSHFDLLGELRTFFEQTRPDFVQRIKEIALNKSRVAIGVRLASGLPAHLANILNSLSGEDFEISVNVDDEPEKQRRDDRRLKWATAGILGLSLVILASGLSPAVFARTLLVGGTMLFFIFLTVQIERR